MPTSLSTGQMLLFIGDSITDCGRRERDVPLGVGYVRMVADLISIREPAKRIQIINRGISGNTVEDLRSRWCDHVLAHRPDRLVVKIGINDNNRWLNTPQNSPNQAPEKFAAIYEEVIALTRRELPETHILLVSSFYASRADNAPAYRQRVLASVQAYVDAARAIATRHSVEFLDLHAAVQDLIAAGFPPDAFAEDAIHPGAAGALFIAEQVYAALEHP